MSFGSGFGSGFGQNNAQQSTGFGGFGSNNTSTPGMFFSAAILFAFRTMSFDATYHKYGN